jgi:hypothetical protein
MSKPNALRALDPLEYRFTDPQDVARYGDGWRVYDEAYWLRLRARDLIAIEGRLNMSLLSVMNGMRSSTTLGDTAAAWLGMVAAGQHVLAGEFDEFNPVTNLIEWREYEGKAVAVAEDTQPAPAPAQPDTLPPEDPDLPMVGPWQPTTSVRMDTVVLQNLPDVV